ncbi:hypothetical protein Kpol_1018p63 [Vanderwaltozyma polyspora DSM 70294]|uniref:DDHD domain-containing protein n=1 Tax=Vanderwaltozyma polyspora (strain ATCC 22028 / DSM 70294 / BCRC 21397 / CBS 2163 / NBRC 10782 / NRRL Y-8283 / UCD 57-17) TaxID=436907 RepID=A7TDR1_VANPO|nr:uncharacterized protein Kpol_1018p63 [Vanderwaltozyma polyspora DSM 70294]EDO19531.1 hypothetical protein Kpol_1018p63 [Vanderwaltozyma polyspora DSM 70294]
MLSGGRRVGTNLCYHSLYSTSSKSNKMFTTGWFYATDVPKSKPLEGDYKMTKAPASYVQFSKHDSKRLEELYQRLHKDQKVVLGNAESFTISVNEDYLFEVDLRDMELKPIYWSGAGFEVRRGIWFDTNGNPLSKDLTLELEQHYSKVDFEGLKAAGSGAHRIFNLIKDYKEGSLISFIDDKSALILKDINGGQLQLQFLKTSLGQSLPLNVHRVIRGYNNVQSKSGISINKIMETKDLDKDQETKSNFIQFGNFSELLNSELTDIMGLNRGETTLSAEEYENNIFKSEIENDYSNPSGNEKSNKRDVKHLIFCVHGIGQTLGKRYEQFNFSHTVNQLRKNIKAIYDKNSNLREENKKIGLKDWETNCNVQVLPISWRHSIGFHTDAHRKSNKEANLPTLEDVTVNGILPFRKMLGDVGLDILLYDDPHYKDRILHELHHELNNVYTIFKKKNPNFDGQVHIVGHSLGSLISFDVLSDPEHYKLDFQVNNFFCIGSPVGVFKLVQRTRIGNNPYETRKDVLSQIPSCKNLYNIFHICDPIAYRMEPLVELSMADFEQEYLPHFEESGIAYKMLELSGNFLKEFPVSEKQKASHTKVTLPVDVVMKLKKLNSSGRIDYALSPNLLNVDMISAISSHVSYFEDMDIAGFLLKETIGERSNPTEIEVKHLNK